MARELSKKEKNKIEGP